MMDRSNNIMVLCVFHEEKTPSLRIWSTGHFHCFGCRTSGDVREHPALFQVFEQKRVERLEAAGQLRFPGF